MRKFAKAAAGFAAAAIMLTGCVDVDVYEPPRFSSAATEPTQATLQPGTEVWCLTHVDAGFGGAAAPRYWVVAQVGDYVAVTYLVDEDWDANEVMERIGEFAEDDDSGIKVYHIDDVYTDGATAQAAAEAENIAAFGEDYFIGG